VVSAKPLAAAEWVNSAAGAFQGVKVFSPPLPQSQKSGKASVTLCMHCLLLLLRVRMEGGRLMYVREAKQEQLLLMHLLVVALDLEGWHMAPQQFEMLRRELKATPADVITR